MKRFLGILIAFSFVCSLLINAAVADDDAQSQPAMERTTSFEGQGGEFVQLISESGGVGFVSLLGVMTLGVFSLLWIAGRKSALNRNRLANYLAAVSKGRTQ